MKYTNIINVVTTENGLRELIGNPIFEMAEKISRLSNDRLYHVVITVDTGWYASDSTRDVIDRLTSNTAVTKGISAAAQQFIASVLSQSHAEFYRTGDNPKDVEQYIKLDPAVNGIIDTSIVMPREISKRWICMINCANAWTHL